MATQEQSDESTERSVIAPNLTSTQIMDAYEKRMQSVPFYGMTTNQNEYYWKKPIPNTKTNNYSSEEVLRIDAKPAPQIFGIPESAQSEGNPRQQLTTTAQEFFDAKEVSRPIRFKPLDHFGVNSIVTPLTAASTDNSSQTKASLQFLGTMTVSMRAYTPKTPSRCPAERPFADLKRLSSAYVQSKSINGHYFVKT
ncbi:hypothetical protein Tcan_08302 [Toxocara canis]|uniref:Uncharacterized protein n=1 Tax=Toxocara canis TaxID=6265 RepID=A0A0B2UYA0_TOXCA|nr:hypothetical protein Tcan_08302 [Toxocara canis]